MYVKSWRLFTGDAEERQQHGTQHPFSTIMPNHYILAL